MAEFLHLAKWREGHRHCATELCFEVVFQCPHGYWANVSSILSCTVNLQPHKTVHLILLQSKPVVEGSYFEKHTALVMTTPLAVCIDEAIIFGEIQHDCQKKL